MSRIMKLWEKGHNGNVQGISSLKKIQMGYSRHH